MGSVGIGILGVVLISLVVLLGKELLFRLELYHCKIDDAFSGNTFSYKGKLYNRDKYIQDRIDELRGRDLKYLEKLSQNTFVGRTKYEEFDRAEVEAVRFVLEEAKQK